MSTKSSNDSKCIIINKTKYKFMTNEDIEFLIKKFGKKTLNKDGETIYHLLLQRLTSKELINFLILKMMENEALLLKDNTGWTPLHYLGMMGLPGIIMYVDSFTVADNNGITPYAIFTAFQSGKYISA